MDSNTFDVIYERLKKHLKYKKNTRPKDRIPGKLRLALVLEFLASGTIGRHMSSIYRISQASFGIILDQVCEAIVLEFKSEFMEFSDENWLKVANDYNYKWNLPNCLGAIDGKHVAIMCPYNSGSLFYNYKVCILIEFLCLLPPSLLFMLFCDIYKFAEILLNHFDGDSRC